MEMPKELIAAIEAQAELQAEKYAKSKAAEMANEKYLQEVKLPHATQIQTENGIYYLYPPSTLDVGMMRTLIREETLFALPAIAGPAAVRAAIVTAAIAANDLLRTELPSSRMIRRESSKALR